MSWRYNRSLLQQQSGGVGGGGAGWEGTVNFLAGGTTTAGHASVTPTADALQVYLVHVERGSSTTPVQPTSVTGNGLTFAKVLDLPARISGVTRTAASLWFAQGSSPTTGGLTVTGFTTSLVSSHRVEITGVKTQAAILDFIRQSKVSTVATGGVQSVTFDNSFGSSPLVIAGSTSYQAATVEPVAESPLIDVPIDASKRCGFGYVGAALASPAIDTSTAGNQAIFALELDVV